MLINLTPFKKNPKDPDYQSAPFIRSYLDCFTMVGFFGIRGHIGKIVTLFSTNWVGTLKHLGKPG